MSNKHPWKYNHYRIIKNLERCPFCSHIPFFMRSSEQISFDQAQVEGPPVTLCTWSESEVGETMFEEGLKRPLPEGEENEKDNLQRK